MFKKSRNKTEKQSQILDNRTFRKIEPFSKNRTFRKIEPFLKINHSVKSNAPLNSTILKNRTFRKVKHSVNMVRLDTGTYDTILALLESELELNALEKADNFPTAFMMAVSSKHENLFSSGVTADMDCNYCKENGYMVNEYEKSASNHKTTYPESGICGKLNYPQERSLKRAGAHLRLKRNKPD